ncbi:hypothetical protein [Ensifer sp. SL37]|uniref:hypothetical protein n=1 Tax=Ensifer sp. SL37 TaxID=2995137 RepID=UPI002275EFFD|nr:hypothetical protein [Ensifer sp. SL37]MCY1740522.1 hypothetical protein [Ensifer sp. SL37]
MTQALIAQRPEGNDSARRGPRPVAPTDPVLEGLLLLCQMHDRTASAAQLTAGLPLKDGKLTLDIVDRATWSM